MDMMCVPKVTDAPTPINSITTTTHRHRHQVGTSKDEFRSLGHADQVHALRQAALRECRGSLQTLVTASEGWVRDECLKHWHALVNDVEDEAERWGARARVCVCECESQGSSEVGRLVEGLLCPVTYLLRHSLLLSLPPSLTHSLTHSPPPQ